MASLPSHDLSLPNIVAFSELTPNLTREHGSFRTFLKGCKMFTNDEATGSFLSLEVHITFDLHVELLIPNTSPVFYTDLRRSGRGTSHTFVPYD